MIGMTFLSLQNADGGDGGEKKVKFVMETVQPEHHPKVVGTALPLMLAPTIPAKTLVWLILLCIPVWGLFSAVVWRIFKLLTQ
jgi:hypothetical protein